MHVATTVSAPPSRAAPPPSRVHAPARARVAASSRVASRRPASIPGPSRGVILVRASSSSSDADDVVDADDLGVDVDAIKSMLESNPTVRAQEALIAGEARNAASLRVDADLAEAREKLAMEYGGRAQSSAENLQTTQEKALAELEAKSEAVLRAEAKMNAIAAEREALAREMDAARGGGGENNEMNASSSSSGKWGSTVASDVDEDAERVESGKAGALAALSGTLLSSPLLLSQSTGGAGFGDPVALQSVAGVLVSCLVFGVTYRYAVRDDFGNDQLKGGVVGAFGLTRGLGAADVFLHGSDASALETWAQAALLVGEGVLVFAFAAVALEAGFKSGALRAFPMKKKNAR